MIFSALFHRTLLLLIGGVVLASATNSAGADPSPTAPAGLTALEHPWGRFAPKSWCRIQTTVWTNQDGKRTYSLQETLTTLESVEKDGLTLKEMVAVTMGGKWVENPTTLKRFDFYQEAVQDGVKVLSGKTEKRVICNTVIPCEVKVYEYTGTAGKQTTTIWYSRQIFPYVLRVARVLRSIPTEKEPEEKVIDQTVCEVMETSAFSLLKSKRGTYRLRTTQVSGGITFISDAECSLHVPGGVYRKITRELDKNGVEIRMLDTRLINFFTMPPELPMVPITEQNVPENGYEFYYEPVPVPVRRQRYYTAPIMMY